MLLGRERERHEIDQALATARAGASATLTLAGEPGIGKTALLGYAAERATGMQVLRARGIESEAQIPFGSLLELLRPALAMLDQIPEPQAAALQRALALRRGTAQERFAVGAATPSVLAAHAEQDPVLVLVDDAQWLDVSSAQALLFAFRRLVADPIAVIVAVREGEPSLLDGADLPGLRLGGLTSDEAAQLMPGLAPETAVLLHRATAGNPLALLELASDSGDLALAPEGAPVLVSARISQAFLHRVALLSQAAQDALVLVAASDTGDLRILRKAAAGLGIDLASLPAAESAGLVTLLPGAVEFRHPLARLRAALDVFDRLGAGPWADRASAELAATGETLRRRDPNSLDELTPQELQIALALAGGRTTRETAAALFLSPKTVEYHLRHVYVKLGIHSREELAQILATQGQ